MQFDREHWQTTLYNNVLIRSGEAPAIGWSRNMLYLRFNTLHRSVIRRQTGFAARITRTLCRSTETMPSAIKFNFIFGTFF